MRFTPPLVLVCFVAACSAATWADTFRGTAARTVDDAGVVFTDEGFDDVVVIPDEAGSVSPGACTGLAGTNTPPPIVVTFPGHGTATESIHVVVGSKSCDMQIDTDSDGLAFVGDALACAPLIAPGTPSSATATLVGSGSPSDLLFQWDYSLVCTIDDDYSLGKQ